MGETNIDESPEVCDHYFKSGALSLGLALLARSLPVLNLLSLALIIYTCIPILNRGLRQVLQKRAVGHDLLYSTYIILAFITRQQMFIALGVFFYHSGAKILSMAQAMSKPLVSSLVERQSETVWIIKEGVELETPLEQVVAGDIVQIRAGEIIPVDGVILDGIAMIDQHALTGESQPAEKEAGATVLSSTLVVSGRIRVQVTKAGKDTTISKITQILNNTSAYTTSIQLKGEEWSNYIAIPVLALTAIAIPTKGLLTATTVSHSTFGNRLRIAAPIGTLSYLHEALNTGLLIKDGRVIEELDQVDTVLFDKTGTLTHEQPEVGKIICARDRYSQMDILAYAATAEQKLTHPLARAIQQKAKELCLDLPSVEDSNLTIGHGISVAIGSKLVRVGSLRFMRAERVEIPTLIT
ncbi:MAG: HAD-IC family P-type ATPase, partial [Thiohalocapsa sp.]